MADGRTDVLLELEACCRREYISSRSLIKFKHRKKEVLNTYVYVRNGIGSERLSRLAAIRLGLFVGDLYIVQYRERIAPSMTCCTSTMLA